MPTFEGAFGPPADPTLQYLLRHAVGLTQWIRDLHQRGYAHRDLSPDHIFTTDGFLPVVVDFGMTKCTNKMPRSEAQLYEGYDLQAFGMILWELIAGRHVFAYRSERLAAQIVDEIKLIRLVGLPVEVVQLIARCLSVRSEFSPDGVEDYDPFESARELHATLSAVNRDRA